MPGVPTSRGCNSCRAKKKKCDEAKPSCTRCTLLKIKCVGSGVKRFKFMPIKNVRNSVITITSPRPAPSNEITKLAGELVSLLKIQDVRYDGFAYVDFLHELPRRLGSNPTVDAGIKAGVAAFKAIYDKNHKARALHSGIDAMSKLRVSLQSPEQASTPDTMCAIVLAGACHRWIGGHSLHPPKNGRILMRLLGDAVARGRISDFSDNLLEQIMGFIIGESFWDHEIEFHPWFWDIFDEKAGARPVLHSPIVSALPQSMIEVAIYLRDPGRYIYQIRCVYDLMLSEQEHLYTTVEEMRIAAANPNASITTQRLSMGYNLSFITFLSQALILNRVLQIYQGDVDLCDESVKFCDDIIAHAKASTKDRPFGSSAVPGSLMAAAATASEPGRVLELNRQMADYQSDFDGVNYFVNTQQLKRVFESMESHFISNNKGIENVQEEERWHPNMEGVVECTIL